MSFFDTIGNAISTIFTFPIRCINLVSSLYTPVLSVVNILPTLLVLGITGVIAFFGIRTIIDLL